MLMLQKAHGVDSTSWLQRRFTSSYVPRTATRFGSNTPMLTTFCGSRSTGMNTKHSRPARAEYAATALARFPVDAHAIVSKPCERAQLIATDTTRSLNELVGFMLSFFRYRLRRPSSWPRRSALTSGVNPSPSVTTGVESSTGSRSR